MTYQIQSWSTKTPADAETVVTLKKQTEVFPGVFSNELIDIKIEGFFPEMSEELLSTISTRLIDAKLIKDAAELVTY